MYTNEPSMIQTVGVVKYFYYLHDTVSGDCICKLTTTQPLTNLNIENWVKELFGGFWPVNITLTRTEETTEIIC